MANVNMVFKHNDESVPKETVDKLPKCPVCGAKAYLHGITVDGFWFGWSVGCPRYCLNDGIHGHDYDTPKKKHLAKHGFSTKETAIKWWRKRVSEYGKDGENNDNDS